MFYFLIYLIVFLIPLSLVRFKFFWLPFNIIEVLIYILFLIWILKELFYFKGKKIRDKIKKTDKAWFFSVFLIITGVTLTSLLSLKLQLSTGIWKEWFVAPLIFFLVLIDSVSNKRQIFKILTVLFFSGILVAIISLFYYFSKELTYDGRLASFYLSPNYLVMYLSPILIISLYLYFLVKNNIYKILLIIGYLLIFFVIFLTYSQGALLGLVVAFIITLFWKSKIFKNKKRLLIFLFLVLIIFSVLYCFIKIDDLGSVYSSRSSLASRLMIWRSSWEIIKDQPLGIGPGTFQDYYLSYQKKFKTPYLEWAVPQPHNLFIAFYLQLGFLGFLGFIWLLVLFFKRIVNYQSLLSVFLFAFGVYFLTHGLVDTLYWKADLALLFWLIIVLSHKVNYLSDQ